MKKFIFKISIFVFPVFLFLGLMLFIIFRAGEFFHPLDRLILSNEEYLIGKHHYKHVNALKWRELLLGQKREILILGTSRVMAFRKEMFNKSFYNAGFTIKNIYDYRQFLLNMPYEKLPSILIIGLDQRMFISNNSYYSASSASVRNRDNWNKYQFYPDLNYLKSFYYKIVYSQYDFKKISNHLVRDNNENKIGFDAILNNTGFRKDGSYNFHREVLKAQKFDLNYIHHNSDNKLEIEKYDNDFFGAEILSQDAVNEFRKLIHFCTQNDIYTIAMLNPYPSSIKEKINENSNLHYVNDILPAIAPIIKEENYEVWDLNKLDHFKMNDNEFIDATHGVEVTAIKVLLSIAKEDTFLGKLIDTKKLNEDLERKKNSYLVY